MVIQPSKNSGQAILEWVVLGSLVLVVWCFSWSMAQHVFNKNLTAALAVVNARRGLSGLRPAAAFYTSVKIDSPLGGQKAAQASVKAGAESSTYRIQLPNAKIKRGWSFPFSSVFGSPFSHF